MYVETRGASIWTVDMGPPGGPAIVGVGGWIGSWELWAWPFARLSRHWRAVAFDHRGTGATIAPAESIDHDSLVADVIAVMDALGVERAVLAGESAGTAVAVAAAAAHPDRVAGLVLVDGFVDGGRRSDDDPFMAALRSDYAGTIERFVQACVPDPGQGAVREWGRRILARATPADAMALYRAGGVDVRGLLGGIAAPALVIHCEGDRLAPLEGGRRLAAGLPDARLHVLSGDEHVPTLTRPHEIAGLIEARFGPPSAGRPRGRSRRDR
jgi:pimeloyl-ACP methyl ester carboxylesterase